MKKTLLTLLTAGIIGLSSCNHKTNLSNQTSAKAEYFPELVISSPKEEGKTIKLPKHDSNKEYLQGFLENSEFFNNHFDLSQAISTILKKKEHLYREENNSKDTIFNKKISSVYDLSLSQNQRIYLMLKSLKDSSFLDYIGKIIDEDIEDIYSEHGGIITVSPKLKLSLEVIESQNAKDKIEENNNFYKIPEWAYNFPNLGKFHLHATSYNEGKFAGPGTQDQIISKSEIFSHKEAHEFIITPIKKGKFNIDYLGGNKLIDENPRIIDLGLYDYDTTKINFK